MSATEILATHEGRVIKKTSINGTSLITLWSECCNEAVVPADGESRSRRFICPACGYLFFFADMDFSTSVFFWDKAFNGATRKNLNFTLSVWMQKNPKEVETSLDF